DVRLRRGRAARRGRQPVNLVIREALLAFRRALLLSALSVTTIAFSLFVVGLFGLVAVNLQQALRDVAERVEIVAYLLPGAPIETITLAQKDIEAFPEVQAASYVSEDQVLQRSREIAIMRLVGATDGFVRRPFLLQGALKGMLGGLAAVALSYGAYALINRWLIHAAFFSRDQAVAIVGFGMLIGFFGSAAS